MIPLVDSSWQGRPWQWQLAHAVSDANELVRLLKLPPIAVRSDFPLLVPRPFLARMEIGNAKDPLLRQVLPIEDEQHAARGYTHDPVGDMTSARQSGLLHKYEGRVLVIVSGACAVNCRYCFRRHFPYGDFQPDGTDWESIFETVAGDESIREVILSGGDPLVLSDRRLRMIANRLDDIEHVDTLRLHTRLPVVVPSRVCNALLEWLHRLRMNVVIVVHSNHANEIDAEVSHALGLLKSAGATLLNQSVLLAGVNDDAGAQSRLSRRLFSAGVLPYYLHMLDPVSGAAHFEVSESRALEIMDSVRANLPGYLVPTLVREVAGSSSKVPVSPDYTLV